MIAKDWLHCTPEEVERLPAKTLHRMRAYLRYDAIETNWRYEDNQDLYVGVARTIRKREGRQDEDPEVEELLLMQEAKTLSLKDRSKGKSGEQPERATEKEAPVSKAFRKKG